MGVAIEGSEGSWPGGGGREPALPALDVYGKQPRYLEIFNRGLEPFEFSIQAERLVAPGGARLRAPWSAIGACGSAPTGARPRPARRPGRS